MQSIKNKISSSSIASSSSKTGGNIPAKSKPSNADSIPNVQSRPKVKNEITIQDICKAKILGDNEILEDELDHLAEVCRRYEELQCIETERIRKMRHEALNKERNRSGVIMQDDEHCSVCGALFVNIFNPRVRCLQCQTFVCSRCTARTIRRQDVLCTRCLMEWSELNTVVCSNKAKTGQWFTEKLNMAKLGGRVLPVLPVTALRSSINRKRREKSAASSVVSFQQSEQSNEITQQTLENAANRLRQGNVEIHEPEQLQRKLDGEPYDRQVSQAFAKFHEGEENSSMHHLKTPERRHNRRKNSLDTRSIASGASVASAVSVYSEHDSSFTHGLPITGEILFSLNYDTKTESIRIFIKQARHITAADQKVGTSDTYVKTYLLPDKTKASKRRSSLQRKTLNPIFNEELSYTFPKSDMAYRTLQVSIWHQRPFHANLFLGEVLVPLANFHFSAAQNWYPLHSRSTSLAPHELQMTKGEVKVALKYTPKSGQLVDLFVTVRKASNLNLSTAASENTSKGAVNAYAKVYLLPEKRIEEKHKTKVVKKTNNPTWEETFIFQGIEKTQLASLGVEIVIYDRGLFSGSEFLGCCRLNTGMRTTKSMDATGAERDIWVSMMSKPNTLIESIIPLRSTMD